MWNFDKIQRNDVYALFSKSCGLMWNFDKIQRLGKQSTVDGVVV